ncbi:unnamed protein product [Rhizoctonia solani]|uniref:Uncharacterized protein n=1 Tax=Rhizoctonia solani TaxID=456999 RepID=A0A8H3GY48_9AGAM|nr:unnamed protein product [Rhizoctonia solani]
MAGGSYAPIPQDPSKAITIPYSWALLRWIQARASTRPHLCVSVILLIHLLFLLSFLHSREWSLFKFEDQEQAQWASDAANFDSIFAREAQLPQHNLSVPYPEGRNGRYLQFSNQMWGAGWNNLLQERLLNTILAYETDRAPAHPPRNDTAEDGQRKVLSIPYNALLSGPTSGMSWGAGDQHPRAVSRTYWGTVCPESERRIVDANEVMNRIVGDSGIKIKDSDGIKILSEWTKIIRTIPERCVEVKGTQIFDVFLFCDARLVSLWDTLANHPTLRLLEDSEVVKNAVSRNMAKLQTVSLAQRPFIPKSAGVIQGLLGIHIRRGDFLGDKGKSNGHCLHLAKYTGTYSGWNQLPQLYDRYRGPSRDGLERGQSTPELREYYLRHCLPTPEQIASRIRELREETHARISHIYIANNAEDEFLKELRRVLAVDGWGPNKITTSQELELNWQATSVNNVVDMSILSRAELFIGNGWSTLTSNVVMRRLTTGQSPESTRLW